MTTEPCDDFLALAETSDVCAHCLRPEVDHPSLSDTPSVSPPDFVIQGHQSVGRQVRSASPDYVQRRAERKRSTLLSLDQRQVLIEAQKGLCADCGNPPTGAGMRGLRYAPSTNEMICLPCSGRRSGLKGRKHVLSNPVEISTKVTPT
jgi:hypothetical protein